MFVFINSLLGTWLPWQKKYLKNLVELDVIMN